MKTKKFTISIVGDFVVNFDMGLNEEEAKEFGEIIRCYRGDKIVELIHKNDLCISNRVTSKDFHKIIGDIYGN